ncbi:unnamed protein product [Aureobasidium pullulans]|nr:unnamed protein product [Aureobasidium pullulans]
MAVPATQTSGNASATQSTKTKKPKSKSTWLHTTRRKKRHSYIRTCLTFWILLLAIITIFVVVIVILVKTGVLKKIHIGGVEGEQGKKLVGILGIG